MKRETLVLAVCGKGGVGKTVFSALLARASIQMGIRPLLLIDADPAGGLVSAIGERTSGTLAGARESLIAAARRADDSEKMRLAQQLDYLVLETLVERSDYSLLAMGHSSEKGCFCPANTLLREAIDLLAAAFPMVLIDAEAGLEQINRQVTRRVNQIIAVTDGSRRSAQTLGYISEIVSAERLSTIANRTSAIEDLELPEGCRLLGVIPEDSTLRQFDVQGRSLWDLPPDTPSFVAMQAIARKLLITPTY